MGSRMNIGFIGGGKMAVALAQGFIKAGLVQAADIIASDPAEAANAAFHKATGGRTTAYNPDVLAFAEVIVLAVKPDHVAHVLSEAKSSFTEKHLLVSIAAGVPTSRLEASLGDGMRVIRVMPNTPALVGASATALALGAYATPQDGELALRLFSAVGLAYQVREPLLDAVTGLSGSGPAYGYLVIEALSDGGVAAGLPRDIATRLAAQTMLGAARMVLETGLHPGALKDMVTSPGGTTIEGVHQLERGGLRAALISAVRAAAEKSKQLGQG